MQVNPGGARAGRAGRQILAPDLAGRFDHERKLAPLVVLGELVAADGGGEAALRRQREALQRDKFCGLLDPAQQRAHPGGVDLDSDEIAVRLRQCNCSGGLAHAKADLELALGQSVREPRAHRVHRPELGEYEIDTVALLLQQEKMKMLAEDESALKRLNIRDLAMSYGIYADKFFMATDGNKVVVEHKTAAPSLEDAVKAIEEAKAKLKASSVDVLVKPVEPSL